MACVPSFQLYDGSRLSSTNREVFCAREDLVTQVTAEGLTPGQEIPILVEDETGEFVPYVIDFQPVVLTYLNSSIVVEPGSCYRLDTSSITGDPDITVTAQSLSSDVATSQTACYYDPIIGNTPVEIIRYSDGQEPIIYRLGTTDRIVDITNGNLSITCPDYQEIESFYEYSPTGEVDSYELRTERTQSMTVSVLEGEVTLTDINGVSQIVPAGVTLTWTVNRDQDSWISGFLVDVPATASAVITYTTLPAPPGPN